MGCSVKPPLPAEIPLWLLIGLPSSTKPSHADTSLRPPNLLLEQTTLQPGPFLVPTGTAITIFEKSRWLHPCARVEPRAFLSEIMREQLGNVEAPGPTLVTK